MGLLLLLLLPGPLLGVLGLRPGVLLLLLLLLPRVTCWLEQLASQAVSLRLIGPRLSYENCHKYMAAERWSSAPTSHS